MKLKKCELFENSVSFLGHLLSSNGLSVEEDKIKCMREWPLPKCVRDVQSFIGTCSYCRNFIKNISQTASPLTELLKQDVE